MDDRTPKFSSAGQTFEGAQDFSRNLKAGAGGVAVESVQYNAETVKKHIDMNPPRVTEPLTGSSVIVEGGGRTVNGQPVGPDGTLPNGFRPGYGPNSAMPRIEQPKKPKMRERIRRTFGDGDKKKKKRNMIIFFALIAALLSGAAYVLISGIYKIDYSETYAAAREVRSKIQEMKSDANCDKVVDYADNGYTTMQAYSTYIEGCKAVGESATADMIAKLGETEGVVRDPEVRKRYETFKSDLIEAGNGSEKLNKTLELYSTWHKWIYEEETGNTKYTTYEWSETDLKKVSDILVNSGNKTLKKYGKEWLKRMKEISELSYKYYHMTSEDTIFTMSELKQKRETALTEFNDWKKTSEPKITEVAPLETVDMAKLYANFSELYEYISDTYETHYNSAAGGCREMVSSVVCD